MPRGTCRRGTRDTAERRRVTVMFSDLVGSTALRLEWTRRTDARSFPLIRNVSPNRAAVWWFRREYMGDGAFVYFGYPQAHEDDAERPLRRGWSWWRLWVVQAGAPSRPASELRLGCSRRRPDRFGGSAGTRYRGRDAEPRCAFSSDGRTEHGGHRRSTRKLLGICSSLKTSGQGAQGDRWDSTRLKRFGGAQWRAASRRCHRDQDRLSVGTKNRTAASRWEGKPARSVVLLSGEAGIGKSRLTRRPGTARGEPPTRLRYFCSPHHQDSAFSAASVRAGAAGIDARIQQQRLGKLESVLTQGTNDLSQVVPLNAQASGDFARSQAGPSPPGSAEPECAAARKFAHYRPGISL